jgi:low affinity Fe/Cu permease
MAKKMSFSFFAKKASYYAGVPGTFVLALSTIIVWATTGPLFHFNDTWQLVINTSTTIITFLMVFLIQNAQNRDSAAVQLKLDELIRATKSAHNSLMDIEELETQELEKIREKFGAVAAEARRKLRAKNDLSAEFDTEKGG